MVYIYECLLTYYQVKTNRKYKRYTKILASLLERYSSKMKPYLVKV